MPCPWGPFTNGPHGQSTAVGVGWRCEGTYKDGFFAKGKAFNLSGALGYEGEWSGGKQHGMGTGFWLTGEVATGRYERGDFVDGTRTSPDGTVIKVVNGKWL